MINCIFRKGLVVGILVLFLVASILPSISGDIENISNKLYTEKINNTNRTIYVNNSYECPGNGTIDWPYCKIQYAIDNASEYDTIFVFSGTGNYYENIIIEKSYLILEGESPDLVTIDGNGLADVIKIHGIFGKRYSNIKISDFTIQNGGITGNGIDIQFCDNTEIWRCLIKSNNNGIHALHTADDMIHNNIVKNNTVGLNLELSDSSEVLDCWILNNNYGIVTDTGWMLTITGNHIENNSIIGISLFRSIDNLVYNNYLNNTPHNVHDDDNNKWYIEKTLGTNIIGGPYLGGNYYSDYTGIDTNCDGLGETPYIIGTNNDIYPLTIVNNEYIPPEITITYPIPGYIYSSKGWKFPPGLPIPSWWAQHKFISFGGFDINAIITDNASVDPNSVFAYIKQASGYKYQLHQDPIIPNLYTGHLDTPGIFSCRLVVEAKDMCGNLGKNESMLLLLYISL